MLMNVLSHPVHGNSKVRILGKLFVMLIQRQVTQAPAVHPVTTQTIGIAFHLCFSDKTDLGTSAFQLCIPCTHSWTLHKKEITSRFLSAIR